MKKNPLYFGSTMEEIRGEMNAGLVKSSGNSIPIICTRHPPDLTLDEEKVGIFEKLFNLLFYCGRRKTIFEKRWD
jgi:hypothetical protein